LLRNADGDGAGDGLVVAGEIWGGDATPVLLEHAAVTSDRLANPKTSARRKCTMVKKGLTGGVTAALRWKRRAGTLHAGIDRSRQADYLGAMSFAWPRLSLGVASAGLIALVVNGTAAAAVLNPYSSGSNGYDVSYVQCGLTAPTGAFGIDGINAGYPFTYYNSCLATEFAAAKKTGNASVYINTGYDPTYTTIDSRHTTSDCAFKETSITGTLDQQKAWAVGCSEAQRDVLYATNQLATSPKAWWLDVETGNSWSTTDLSLNRYTIQGIIETLRPGLAVPVGIYSTAFQWNQITGGYSAPVDADWLATGQRTLKRARQSCGSIGFTGAPIWLVQYQGITDRDSAC
jgi:hypothetical protein